jgi:hypothetical protein
VVEEKEVMTQQSVQPCVTLQSVRLLPGAVRYVSPTAPNSNRVTIDVPFSAPQGFGAFKGGGNVMPRTLINPDVGRITPSFPLRLVTSFPLSTHLPARTISRFFPLKPSFLVTVIYSDGTPLLPTSVSFPLSYLVLFWYLPYTFPIRLSLVLFSL